MPMVARTWNGMELQDRLHRAAGRSIIGIGQAIAVETKRVTHVMEGTLKRSVHAAPAGYDGSGDEDLAESSDLMLLLGAPQAVIGPLGATLEVGSWLPYACVEWVGRQHPGVTQGLEVVRGHHADSIVFQAFREEGL